MKEACFEVIGWLEASGHVPDDAKENIEDARENVLDSIDDFMAGASDLLKSDSEDASVFGSRLMMIERRVLDLGVDLYDMEEALRKTSIVLFNDNSRD